MPTNATHPHFLRNMVGGSVGNILEWYDFAVFGYFAPIIGAHFFPAEDSLFGRIPHRRFRTVDAQGAQGNTRV